MKHLSFPNESADYRAARNALLDAEIDLRRRIEAVAVSGARFRPVERWRPIICSNGSAPI